MPPKPPPVTAPRSQKTPDNGNSRASWQGPFVALLVPLAISSMAAAVWKRHVLIFLLPMAIGGALSYVLARGWTTGEVSTESRRYDRSDQPKAYWSTMAILMFAYVMVCVAGWFMKTSP